MDCLDCKVCNDPYDEEEHRPRTAPCGHDYCTACVQALINNKLFVCPKCRQEHKVDVVDDLLVNFGLIDVIRAFKTKDDPITKESKSISGDANDGVCFVHCKTVSNYCFNCKIWICLDCLESHCAQLGCNTSNSVKALEKIKEKEIVAASTAAMMSISEGLQ